MVQNTNPYHKLPIKRLTAAERQLKIEKGQCYNCEEAWHKGHKCKGQMSLLLLEGVVPEGCEELEQQSFPTEPNGNSEDCQEVEPTTGSLYALIGNPNSRCLRLQGYIQGKALQILIDGGSSHNFIQARVAKYLGLDILPSKQFSVIVGNGENLTCVGQCQQVVFAIQGHTFAADFFVIDLHGADAVLGVAWQDTFGELKLNFKQSYIKFNHEGKEVCLQGVNANTELESISATYLHHLYARNEVAECYILQLVNNSAPKEDTNMTFYSLQSNHQYSPEITTSPTQSHLNTPYHNIP